MTMQVYHGYMPDGQERVFLHDPEAFKLGSRGKDIYTNDADYSEKTRMALFNRMTMELIKGLKNRSIKLNGQSKAINRFMCHEAWQSGGLLGQMRFLPLLHQHYEGASEESTKYFEQLADSSIVIGHNIGVGYQGWEKNSGEMQTILGILYGKYAHPIVKEVSIIDQFYGQKLQRVGFVRDTMNLAHMGVALAGKLGPVSDNYAGELTHEYMSGELAPLIQYRADKKCVIGLPNGVNKAPLILNPTITQDVWIF